MNTDYGYEEAKRRETFMREFLEEFFWNGLLTMKILLQTIGSKITKMMEVVTEVVSSKIFRIIFRKSYFWNTVYQEVVSLRSARVTRNNFKNSFSCLMNIVTCDSNWQENTVYSLFVNKD